MRGSRLLVALVLLVLSFGVLGLAGCITTDTGGEIETEESGDAEESSASGSDDLLVGTWENAEPFMMSGLTFAADGSGTATDVDGTEAPMTWTLEDDYLEITVEVDDGTSMSGGGFVWVTEGEEFNWDIDGPFTKVE